MIKKISFSACLIIPLFSLIIAGYRYIVDVPYWDEWGAVSRAAKLFEGQLSLGDLWKQSNEHRILFPRIIFSFCVYLTKWNNYHFFAIQVFLALCAFFSLIYSLRKILVKQQFFISLWLILVISVILFSLNQYESWLTGMGIPKFLVLFSVVTGSIILCDTPFSWTKFTLSSLLGIIATYSFGYGLAYWFVGLFMLFVVKIDHKQTKRWAIFAWSIISLVAILTYFFKYNFKGSIGSLSGSFQYSLDKPIEYIDFVLTLLGTSLIGFSHQGAMSMGIVGVIIFLWAFRFFYQTTPSVQSVLIPFFAFSLYALGNIFLMGMGRLDFLGSLGALAPRHRTLPTIFWIANAVFLSVCYLETNEINSKKRFSLQKGLIVLSLAVITVSSILNSVNGGLRMRDRYAQFGLAARELLKLKNEQLLKLLHPDPELIKKQVGVLRKYKLSYFRRPRDESELNYVLLKLKRTNEELLLNDGKVFKNDSREIRGRLDSFSFGTNTLDFKGWAADINNLQIPETILVFC